MSLRSRVIRFAAWCLRRDAFTVAGARFRAAQGVLNPTAFRSSLLFAGEALQAAPSSGRALEFGCGLGVAAVLLARRGLTTTAVDRDPRAVRATTDNARRNGVDVQAVLSNWDAALPEDLRFEWIVANPPFLATEQSAFNLALHGGDRLEEVAACTRAMARRLTQDGRGLLMTSERSGRSLVLDTLDAAELTVTATNVRRHWGERYFFDVVQSPAT